MLGGFCTFTLFIVFINKFNLFKFNFVSLELHILQCTLMTTSQFMIPLLGRLHDKVTITFNGQVIFIVMLVKSKPTE